MKNLAKTARGTNKLRGNRCGHIPQSPRYYKPDPHHKTRPEAILIASQRLKVFYGDSNRYFLSLMATKPSERKKRSEARERTAQVAGVLFHYTDLASMRFGVPGQYGDFCDMTLKFIAKQLGWRNNKDDEIDEKLAAQNLPTKDRGVKRVYRSIEEFKRAGYIRVTRYRKKAMKGKVRLFYQKTISDKFFLELGVPQYILERCKRAARNRQRAFNKKPLSKTTSNMQVKKIIESIALMGKTLRPQKRDDATGRIEREKNRLKRCYELKKKEENQALSMKMFYAKYPDLAPE